jgi:energy-coupling factor transporter ATP-binding protein EcfA2
MTLFAAQDVQHLLTRRVAGLLPSRLILVNYWLYPVQVFHFVQGRLFLTGHNGSGKSTALTAAITMLLDGDSSPARLDPFGGTRRQLRYYLLGGPEAGFQVQGRRSYLALEFLKPEGGFETIGLGLSATEGSSNIGKWGFWLPGQVQTDGGLDLVEDGQPLTERALRERVTRWAPQSEDQASGERGADPQGPGEFASGQTEYAGLVRRRIYGASERDVQDTLDLLLTVRGSKLGREVRPAQIAELLRRSLPPVSAGVTGKLAEGIERLDRHAQRLARLDTQTEAARRVAAANFQAALSAARFAYGRQQAAALRAETATAELEAAHAEQAEQTTALAAAQGNDTDLTREQEMLRAQIEAVATQVGGQEDALSATERRLAEARAALEQNRSRLRRERERGERSGARQTALQLAQQERTQVLIEVQRALADRAWWDTEESLTVRAGLMNSAEVALKVYERDTERLTERQDAAAQAGQRADDARRHLEDRTAHLDAVLTRTGAELTARARTLSWDGEPLPGPALEAYGFALETGTEVGSAFISLRDPGAALLAGAREAQGEARDRLRRLNSDLAELSARQQTLLTQTDVPPPLPAGRAEALEALQAAGLSARPLYRLIRPKAASRKLGPLEGALLASGLLTALVVPPEQHTAALKVLRREHLSDALLRPGPAVSANLSALLEPEEGAPEGVEALLAGLSTTLTAEPSAGFGVSGAAAGGWTNGVLAGSAADLGVRYLGLAAREAERERLLAELGGQQEQLAARAELAEAGLIDLNRALALLEAELEYLQTPPDLSHERRSAARERDDAFQALNLRAEAHESALDALNSARQQAAGAATVLAMAFAPLNPQAPSESQIPAGRESLEDAQADFRAAREQWAQAQALQDTLERTRAELEQLTEQLAEHAQETGQLETERGVLEATRDALQTTLLALRGQHDAPDAARLRAQLNELQARARELERARRELIRQLTAAQERLRFISERLPALTAAAAAAQAEVEQADTQLLAARAAHPRLATGAVTGPEQDADLTVPASEREVQAAGYALREEYDRSRPLLEAPESYHPHYTPAGPRFYLQGEVSTPDALFAHLNGESEAARALLTDEEARVFHDELIRELVEELDRKQREAAAWVTSIRRTLDGLRFHDERLDLESRLLPPAGQPAEALARLIDGKVDPNHQPDAWWEGVREEVRGVVRQLQARTSGQDAELSFAQALERSLDYREWLSFAFISVTPTGRREITDRTFAQRSGGERSAVLYTFLFAALGARFDQLGPRVPRLIGLDEAFAGMDLANIGALYHVMSDLELSWIATSERRIDLSPALSGAATYQLIRVATSRGSSVGSLCFVWDGHTAQEGSRYGLVE